MQQILTIPNQGSVGSQESMLFLNILNSASTDDRHVAQLLGVELGTYERNDAAVSDYARSRQC